MTYRDDIAVIELMADAIEDSLGPDWQPVDGARSIMEWLRDNELQIVPAPCPGCVERNQAITLLAAQVATESGEQA